MDREDAAFVADTLACRIAGDKDEIERLAASSLMRLSALATRIRKLADDWPPAHLAADALMGICRRGAAICDEATDPQLQIFVDKMRELVAEPPRPPRNRADRRARAATLPRAARKSIFIPAPSSAVH